MLVSVLVPDVYTEELLVSDVVGCTYMLVVTVLVLVLVPVPVFDDDDPVDNPVLVDDDDPLDITDPVVDEPVFVLEPVLNAV